jgi:hypothetical protein
VDAGEAPNNTSQPDADTGDDAAQGEDTAPDAHGDPDIDVSEDADIDADADVSKDVDVSENTDSGDIQDIDADATEDPSPDGDEDVDVGPRCDEGEMECGQGCVDVLSDADHCGSCEACPLVDGAMAACEQGSCVYECSQGRVDANGDLTLLGSDGCECEPSGVEVCDNIDNDCDGSIDENSDSLCPSLERAAPSCELGQCLYRCLQGAIDLNQDLQSINSNGCECLPTEQELCDGVDNDCDGVVDGLRADSACPTLPNTVQAVCLDSACLQTCALGAVDLDQDLDEPGSNGCECVRSGAEVCDGVDNDCDGLLDESDPDFQPTPCPNQAGVCEGSSQRCEQGRDQGCGPVRYGQHASDQGRRYQANQEITCDEEDNDCDGLTDETCCAPTADTWRTLLHNVHVGRATNLEVAASSLDAPRAYAVAFNDQQGRSFQAQVFGSDGYARGPLHAVALPEDANGEFQSNVYWGGQFFSWLHLFESSNHTQDLLQRSTLQEDGTLMPNEGESIPVPFKAISDYPFFVSSHFYEHDQFLFLDPQPEDPSFYLSLLQDFNIHNNNFQFTNNSLQNIFPISIHHISPQHIYISGFALNFQNLSYDHIFVKIQQENGLFSSSLDELIPIGSIENEISLNTLGDALLLREDRTLEHYYMLRGDDPPRSILVRRSLQEDGTPLEDATEVHSENAEYHYLLGSLSLEGSTSPIDGLLYSLGGPQSPQGLYFLRVGPSGVLDRPMALFPDHGIWNLFAAKIFPHELGALVVMLGEDRNVGDPTFGVHMAVINADGDFMCPWDAP